MFGFVSGRWKFIGLTNLSLIAIALSLLQPKQYQKQVTLSVTPVPISVSGIPGIDIYQASHKTVKLLKNHYDKIYEIEVKPNYNTQTQQINITVRSPDTRFIA
ncbi:hypothetical protein [Coleofasciculus sp. G2-EDA-02]|uniref:hypothetical protein n=1 Tax=Coleofasciculus sp. G2-EDA-02 TaxID=3069529 RepID=UPI0032F818E0